MTDTRIKIISVLILIGGLPLSVGKIFNSPWLTWPGLALIGLACAWFLIDFLGELWRWIRSPKRLTVQTESKTVADEYLRLGWTLIREFDGAAHGESPVYLLEWLRDGKPVRIDATKFSKRNAHA